MSDHTDDEKPRLSEEARKKIIEWVESGETPTVENLVALVADVAGDEIDQFCDSFGQSAASLALFLTYMVNLTDHVREENSNEDMKLVLTGQALEQCRTLAAKVLEHVDASDAQVEMIDVASFN